MKKKPKVMLPTVSLPSVFPGSAFLYFDCMFRWIISM